MEAVQIDTAVIARSLARFCAATVIDVLFTAQSLETGLTLTLLFAPAKETLFDALAIFTTAAIRTNGHPLARGRS